MLFFVSAITGLISVFGFVWIIVAEIINPSNSVSHFVIIELLILGCISLLAYIADELSYKSEDK